MKSNLYTALFLAAGAIIGIVLGGMIGVIIAHHLYQ